MSDPTLKAVICPQCGRPVAPGEAFCRNCGQQVLASTITAPPPIIPPVQRPAQPFPPAYAPPAKKKRSKLMMGCLIFIGLIVVAAGASGIYVWRRTAYTPPARTAPDIPQRAAGTMTEFPVDSDPNSPAKPTSVETETLGGAVAKSVGSSSSATKLPPGIDKSKLAKGATTMTSSTYKPKSKTQSSSSTSTTTKDNIYICVLTAMPGQTGFGDGLATSVMQATGGTQKGVKVQSSKGATYVGTKILSAQANVYVLTKQGADIVILVYGEDPSTQSIVDRLAQNVGNGEGLIDYPELKNSLWTLPATTPSDLTLVEIKTLFGEELIGGGSDVPSEIRSLIPDKMTGARYLDSSRQEWTAVNLEYGSSFAAWRTWLLARSALGLSGGETTTVRDVDAVYMTQEGKRILIFQKGPYLILLSAPSGASVDRLVALGNQFQV